mmetsp:Transcript_58342/g.185949  ORF Transcript_58342/g.185949 Transcript_58342/m.185949 type:complete len:377 (+) Transcript_58342:379-1509(+)
MSFSRACAATSRASASSHSWSCRIFFSRRRSAIAAAAAVPSERSPGPSFGPEQEQGVPRSQQVEAQCRGAPDIRPHDHNREGRAQHQPRGGVPGGGEDRGGGRAARLDRLLQGGRRLRQAHVVAPDEVPAPAAPGGAQRDRAHGGGDGAVGPRAAPGRGEPRPLALLLRVQRGVPPRAHGGRPRGPLDPRGGRHGGALRRPQVEPAQRDLCQERGVHPQGDRQPSHGARERVVGAALLAAAAPPRGPRLHRLPRGPLDRPGGEGQRDGAVVLDPPEQAQLRGRAHLGRQGGDVVGLRRAGEPRGLLAHREHGGRDVPGAAVDALPHAGGGGLRRDLRHRGQDVGARARGAGGPVRGGPGAWDPGPRAQGLALRGRA